MSNFKVTPDEITLAAGSCDSTAQEVQEQLLALKTYVIGLENVWGGIAQNTFQSLMAEYDVYSRMLNDALTDIGQGLRGNYVNYTGSEQANIKSIDAIQATLKGANLT